MQKMSLGLTLWDGFFCSEFWDQDVSTIYFFFLFLFFFFSVITLYRQIDFTGVALMSRHWFIRIWYTARTPIGFIYFVLIICKYLHWTHELYLKINFTVTNWDREYLADAGFNLWDVSPLVRTFLQASVNKCNNFCFLAKIVFQWTNDLFEKMILMVLLWVWSYSFDVGL